MSTAQVNPQDDTSDYSADVSALFEVGSSSSNSNTILPSFNEWRSDAFLLYNKPRVKLEDLISMRRTDGMARALANLVTLPIKLALQQGRWVAPSIGGAEEEVEFANLMWSLPPASGGMTTPWSHVIDQILLSVFDGYAAFELVSQVPKVGPLKGKRTLRKLAYRDPRTLTLLQDERGGYAGFRQQVRLPNGTLLDKTLSPLKTARFTVNEHENPLYGVSYFEACYPHYEAKMRLYYMSEMAAQFAAIPARIGTVPRNAKAAEMVAFRQSLERMYLNTVVLKKEGWEVDAFNSTSQFPFLPMIEHHNMMMSKSILGSFMESEQRTVLVENSTEDASADLFLLSIETLANEFASVLTNHIMPKYIIENFKGADRFPVFKPGPLSDNVRKKITSLFEKVVISGIVNSTPEMVRALEKHVSNDLGLDIDYTEVEAREAEAMEQASQQAEMLAMQTQQETLDQERAAEGGIGSTPPPNPTPSAEAPVDNVAVSDTDSELELMQLLLTAHNNLFSEQPLEEHSVDEGFSSIS